MWETRPTLLVQRDTFANMFHNSEDFFNAFIALAILRWNTADLQVIVADLYPKGPFWDMWSKVFSNVGRQKPLTAWDLKTKYGAKKVCFKVMNEITNLFLLAHLYDRPNISSRKDVTIELYVCTVVIERRSLNHVLSSSLLTGPRAWHLRPCLAHNSGIVADSMLQNPPREGLRGLRDPRAKPAPSYSLRATHSASHNNHYLHGEARVVAVARAALL